MTTDEERVRDALAATAPPGAPALPHQLAGWLVAAMVPLLDQVRTQERRACVQELLDVARWCWTHGVPGRAAEFESGAVKLREPADCTCTTSPWALCPVCHAGVGR